jgi:hypothetical protein
VPAVPERGEVGRHRDGVEPDGPLDRGGRDRQRAALVRRANHDHVGVLLVPQVLQGQGRGVDETRVPGRLPENRPDLLLARVAGGHRDHHAAGRDFGQGDHRDGFAGVGDLQVGRIRRDQRITPQVQIAFSNAQLRRARLLAAGDRQVGDDGAALLGQPGLVQRPHRPALDGRGGGQHL